MVGGLPERSSSLPTSSDDVSLTSAKGEPGVKVEGATESKSETGRTTRTYDVKLNGIAHKVTIGYDPAALSKQYGIESGAGNQLAKVIDSIVNKMDANALIAMVGTKVQASIDGNVEKGTKVFQADGHPKSLESYQKGNDEEQALGSSISKIVSSFQKSTVMNSITSAKDTVILRDSAKTPPPSAPPASTKQSIPPPPKKALPKTPEKAKSKPLTSSTTGTMKTEAKKPPASPALDVRVEKKSKKPRPILKTPPGVTLIVQPVKTLTPPPTLNTPAPFSFTPAPKSPPPLTRRHSEEIGQKTKSPPALTRRHSEEISTKPTELRATDPGNTPIREMTKLDPKEAKLAAKLQEGKMPRFTNRGRLEGLLIKELARSISDPTKLQNSQKTLGKMLATLESKNSKLYEKIQTENQEIKKLIGKRTILLGAMQEAGILTMPISNYGKQLETHREFEQNIKNGKITINPKVAEQKKIPNAVFKAQLQSREKLKDQVTQTEKTAKVNETKLTVLAEKYKGTSIGKHLAEQAQKLKEFNKATQDQKVEMSTLASMAAKTPMNMLAGIGSNYGTAFPPEKPPFTASQSETGQLQLTHKFLTQQDPENAKQHQALTNCMTKLDAALLKDSKIFSPYYDKKNPASAVTDDLANAIASLKAELNSIKNEALKIGYKVETPKIGPDLDPNSVTFEHVGATSREMLVIQCDANLRHLEELETRLSK